MAGGADRRRAGAGYRQAGHRLHACLLLRRVPDHGRHRPDPRPRPAVGFARGCGMIARLLGPGLLGAGLLITVAAAAQAEPVEDFYRGKTIELLIGGAT